MLENDLVEAIVALPTDMFYNTGISTYVWILSNRKPEARRGYVQLIDASAMGRKMRKSLGSKRKELADEDTRNGVFGLSPGIELALVSSSQDARRFHLWEASPLEYLERLDLQNQLVPGLNRLEGVIVQANGEMAIVTSQPRFDIVAVGVAEIDAWFAAQGFAKIADAAYYRAEDNLGVFDAHDKNLIRAGELLVPFDVIPCHPGGGFLAFIEDTLAAGHSLKAVRTLILLGPARLYEDLRRDDGNAAA